VSVVAQKDEMEEMEENITQQEVSEGGQPISAGVSEPEPAAVAEAQALAPAESAPAAGVSHLRRRQEKVGLVTSDKMQKTVTVRVERQVRHPKYRRYIRRRSKFLAHDELGAHTGDIVRIVETRPLSARKRWRVVEIVQRAS
jgi:small subunit ribosomal protein S17